MPSTTSHLLQQAVHRRAHIPARHMQRADVGLRVVEAHGLRSTGAYCALRILTTPSQGPPLQGVGWQACRDARC